MTPLPTGWHCASLAELGIRTQPGFASGVHTRTSIGIPHLRPMNISRLGQIDMSDVKYVEDGTDRRVAHGDVLFNNTNSPALVGKTAYVASVEPLAYSNHMTRLRYDPAAIDGRFLAYQLHGLWAAGYFKAICSNHVNQASVASGRLAQVEIAVASLEEQRRIVGMLEDHLSRLDAADRGAAAAVARTAPLIASDAMRIASGAGARLTGERVMFGDVARLVPKGWRESTVGAEASLIEYGTSAKTNKDARGGSVPVIRMGNLQRGRLELGKLAYLPRDHPDLATKLLLDGDLLFNRTNSAELVGKSAVYERQRGGPHSFASYLIRAHFKADLRPAWASMVINSPLGRSYIASVASQQVGQANVNGTKLKAFPLLVPPIDEQDRLLRDHLELIEGGERLRKQHEVIRDRSSVLRRALLQAAFSGQLTGRSSDLDRAEEATA